MKIIGIIPARMESTRLPGKPLIKLGNKSMIQRVYESAIKCGQLNDLFVATPNDEIYDHVSTTLLTSENESIGFAFSFKPIQLITKFPIERIARCFIAPS